MQFLTITSIWFSFDPEIAIPEKFKKTLIERAQFCKSNNLEKSDENLSIKLVYSSALLSESALIQLKQFASENEIKLISIEEIETTIKSKNLIEPDAAKKLQLINFAKVELEYWKAIHGGSPAVASDMIRWVILDPNTFYMDLDIPCEEIIPITNQIINHKKTKNSPVTYLSEGNNNAIFVDNPSFLSTCLKKIIEQIAGPKKNKLIDSVRGSNEKGILKTLLFIKNKQNGLEPNIYWIMPRSTRIMCTSISILHPDIYDKINTMQTNDITLVTEYLGPDFISTLFYEQKKENTLSNETLFSPGHLDWKYFRPEWQRSRAFQDYKNGSLTKSQKNNFDLIFIFLDSVKSSMIYTVWNADCQNAYKAHIEKNENSFFTSEHEAIVQSFFPKFGIKIYSAILEIYQEIIPTLIKYFRNTEPDCWSWSNLIDDFLNHEIKIDGATTLTTRELLMNSFYSIEHIDPNDQPFEERGSLLDWTLKKIQSNLEEKDITSLSSMIQKIEGIIHSKSQTGTENHSMH